MERVPIDSAYWNKLPSLNQPVELCNETGEVLGRFIPSIIPPGWEPVGPDISDEELDRRERSGEKRYSTAEVIASLEKHG